MTRENVETRGRRLLTEGRLILHDVHGDTIRAVCRGSGELHHVGHDPARGWWCTCEARGRCSHLVALELVTVRNRNAR